MPTRQMRLLQGSAEKIDSPESRKYYVANDAEEHNASV